MSRFLFEMIFNVRRRTGMFVSGCFVEVRDNEDASFIYLASPPVYETGRLSGAGIAPHASTPATVARQDSIT